MGSFLSFLQNITFKMNSKAKFFTAKSRYDNDNYNYNYNMIHISGKIIDNETIEYYQVINYTFRDVLPFMTTDNGITHIKFIGLDTKKWHPLSELYIYETYSNEIITLHVSCKEK